jgi:glycosyltransferase involved in cell wall biosynthesis
MSTTGMKHIRWAIISGEYPPMAGGVSDYTRLLAQELVKCGDEVHIWCPACEGTELRDAGVQVHRLVGHFGPAALRRLTSELQQMPQPYEILVQYVPHAFGWKAMNLPFCLWLYSRRRDQITVMFHEAVVPISWSQPLSHNFLGVVTRIMAALVLRASKRNFVSVPTWLRFLEPLRPRAPLEWLPVPANIPCERTELVSAALHQRISARPDVRVVAHFGTFGAALRSMLANLLPPLLAGGDRMGLLIGPGGVEFAGELVRAQPALEGRFYCTGALLPDQVAPWLGAADILVQPYPDGASGRRGTLMAGLALGLPIVTNEGAATEPVWRESCAVRFAPADSPEMFASAVDELLADENLRRTTARNGLALYAGRFAVGHTVSALRRSAGRLGIAVA